jgi:hypothetical protein
MRSFELPTRHQSHAKRVPRRNQAEQGYDAYHQPLEGPCRVLR